MSAVTLDFSKSQPLKAPGPVTLDFSKAQKLDESPVEAPAPPNSVVGGVGRRISGTGLGILGLFAPPTTPAEKKAYIMGPGALAAFRMGKGELSSREEALSQAKEQFQDASKITSDPLIRNLTRLRAGLTGASALLPIPGIASSATNVNTLSDQGRNREATGEGLTDAALFGLGSRKVAPIERMAKPFEKYAPKTITVEGKPIPVLAGDTAAPGSHIATKLESIRRSGAGRASLEEFERRQQAAARETVRSIAQKAGGGPKSLSETPRGQLFDAANQAKAQAQELYQNLDASLTKVPVDLSHVSTLTQKAYIKAKSLGAPLETPFDPNHPLQGAQAVRSELLRVSRSSADPKVRSAASSAANDISASIEKSLSRKPTLLNQWHQANSLYKKQAALREVSDSLERITEGTRPEMQAAGMARRPPRIQGGKLADTLRNLDAHRYGQPVAEGKGDLTAALGQEQAKALFNVADILDQAQGTKLGREQDLVGHGYSPHSVAFHSIVNIVRRMGQRPFVNAMLGKGFAHSINELTKARTGPSVDFWASRALAEGGNQQ